MKSSHFNFPIPDRKLSLEEAKEQFLSNQQKNNELFGPEGGPLNLPFKLKMNDENYFKRLLVCAALRHKDTRLIICGARHFDGIMRAMIEKLGGVTEWKGHCYQGFIDNMGMFVSREEAWNIAKENGQIRREVSGEGKLYSENLY